MLIRHIVLIKRVYSEQSIISQVEKMHLNGRSRTWPRLGLYEPAIQSFMNILMLKLIPAKIVNRQTKKNAWKYICHIHLCHVRDRVTYVTELCMCFFLKQLVVATWHFGSRMVSVYLLCKKNLNCLFHKPFMLAKLISLMGHVRDGAKWPFNYHV